MRRRNEGHSPGAAHSTATPGGSPLAQDIFNDPIFARTQRYVDAVHHDRALELPEYADNPLILSLPAFTDSDATIKGLEKYFAVSCPPTCATWSKERRLMSISRIERCLITLPFHVSLLEWLHVALRNHYHQYNPCIDYQKKMQDAYRRVQAGEPGVVADLVEGHSACRALIGMSGTGKSTALKLVLSLFPPIIRHKDIRNPECSYRQLVWIYITCPANGSVRTFLMDILKWVDEHLDTHYREEMAPKASSGDYVLKVVTVLMRHFTGVLVIDEFQNLLRAAASTELLDTIVNLLNSRCCCMMVMGTPEVEPLIQTRLRLARRVSNDGYEILEPLSAGEVYDKLVNPILALNFLRNPIEDLQRVKSAILRLSAGLPALIKLLVRIAQCMAIETEGEQLTPTLLAEVQRELLGPLTAIVKALNKQDSVELARYVDILGGEAARVQRRAMNRTAKAGGEDFHNQVKKQTFASAVSALLALGFTQSDADQWVNLVLREMPTLTSYAVVLEVLQRGEKSRSPSAPPTAA